VKVGIISVFVDYHRRGRHHRGALQPQIGPLIAALLPDDVEIDIVNDTWEDPDWSRDYDLLFISCLHSDLDRARQIAHYWRRRGAKTVLGGIVASLFPKLCAPFFDAVVVGDPEDTVPRVYRDFCAGELQPLYVSGGYRPESVPIPRSELIANKQPIPLGLEATRGCPFACEFCALTGFGTRFHTRKTADVVRDIEAIREALRHRVPWYRRNKLGLYDNNIGGSFSYLRELCDALRPLGLLWGAAITFNGASNPELVRRMAQSGCRWLYVGLESLNPVTLASMNKGHNQVHRVRELFDQCRAHGIVLSAGLMISPTVDNCAYLDSLPKRLRNAGLYVPTYVGFETPFPGTPLFKRLAAATKPALLPNALLRDFTGYSLVVRPTHEPIDRFIESYRRLLGELYSLRNRVARVLRDLPRFAADGNWFSIAADAAVHWPSDHDPSSARSYVTGTDTPPPETVPLSDADFDSEEERARILEPWRVTDETGRVLPMWLGAEPVFANKGRVVVHVPELVTPPSNTAEDCGPMVGRPAIAN
jgi:hypothetical protein